MTMSVKKQEQNQLARFTNVFAVNAELGIKDARQLRLFLALVSQTNPQDATEEMSGILSITDIAHLITKGGVNKSHSLYAEVRDFTEKIMKSNYVAFDPQQDLGNPEANKHLKNYGVIFDRLELFREGSSTFCKYRFHEDMRPHIKHLKQNFVSLAIPRGMKSGHAIRFLLLAKAHHDKYRNGGRIGVTKMSIAVSELRRILGIEKKYPKFSDLRKWVIEPIVKDIKKSGLLYIHNYDYTRTGRVITNIDFYFQDGNLYRHEFSDTPLESRIESPLLAEVAKKASLQNDFIPTKLEVERMHTYQYFAYQFLLKKGIKKGITYSQIIPSIPSSEFNGFEDIYFQQIWKLFESKTKYKDSSKKAGAFVKWYMNGEFKNRHFSEIMEQIQIEKKRLLNEDSERWENRQIVKNMPYTEFLKWLDQERKKKNASSKDEIQTPSRKKEQNNYERIGNILAKKYDAK